MANLSWITSEEAARNTFRFDGREVSYDPGTGTVRIGTRLYPSVNAADNAYAGSSGYRGNDREIKRLREWLQTRSVYRPPQPPQPPDPDDDELPVTPQTPVPPLPPPPPPPPITEPPIPPSGVPQTPGPVPPGGDGGIPDPGRRTQENAEPDELQKVISADWYNHTLRQMLDHDKWLNENAWAHQQNDLASGDALRNVNRQTSADTLRLSRMADVLNNRYYRNPARIDDRIALVGGGTSGNAVEYGTLYRRPIETEETRQMDRSRQYESMVRAAEVERQSAVRGMDIEMARARLQAQLAQATGLSEDQRRRIMAIFEYGLSYDTARYQLHNQQVLTHYTNVLTSMRIPYANARFIAQQVTYNPIMSGLLSQMTGGGVLPSQSQALFLNAAAEAVSRLGANATPAERLNAFYGEMVRLMQQNITTAAIQLFGGDTPENRERVQQMIQQLTRQVQSVFTGAGDGE